MTSSHPQIPLKPWKPFPCRTLLPIYPPADPLNYPPLPSPLRKPAFSALFSLSTHIIPAAHLRRGPRLPIPDLPSPDTPRDERVKAFSALSEGFQQRWIGPTIKNDKHENILWNVLNRYVRNGLNGSNSTGITLFFAHANGYPKEVMLLD